MRYTTVLMFAMCLTLSASRGEDAGPTAGEAWTVPDLGMKFVWLKPGTFTMGSPANEAERDAEESQHEVVLAKGFWCGVYEVTQAEWESLMGENPSHVKGPRLPVGMVTWEDAVAFCAKLNERERALGRVPAGYAYRLPTEAEWEYACRAGTTGAYAGDLNDHAWHFGNSESKPHDVGGKRPNAWGLYDMHGNAWEWCLDWYAAYPAGPVTDPAGPAKGWLHVMRGGSWSGPAKAARSAQRAKFSPVFKLGLFGFRVILAPAK